MHAPQADARNQPAPVAIALAILAFWVLPGHPAAHPGPGEWIHPLNLGAVLLLSPLLFLARWRATARTVQYGLAAAFLALAMCSALLHATSEPGGLEARYYADPGFSSPVERSWRFPDAVDYTRIDERIDFRLGSHSFHRPVFPIHFYNEWRHPSLQEPDVRRHALFSATWRGYIYLPANVDGLRLRASGGQATLVLDGQSVKDGTWSRDRSDAVEADGHTVMAIEATFARTKSPDAALQLLWMRGQREEVVPGHALSPAERPTGTPGWITSTPSGWLNAGVWLTLLAITLAWFRPRLRWNASLRAWFVLAVSVALATVYVHGKADDLRWLILGVGDDALVYEGLARQILFGDIASRAEGPLVGMNFGYRYVVAAMHLLVGEAPALVLWLQIVLMLGTVLACWAGVHRLHGPGPAAVFVLLAAAGGLYFDFARMLLDTTFAIGLSCMLLYALLRYRRSPSTQLAATAGCAMGAVLLLRTNLLAFVPMAAAWMFIIRRKAPRARWCEPLLFVLLSALLLSLIGLRNLVVSGEAVFMPTNGIANLWVANHPPEYIGPTYFTPAFPDDGRIVERVLVHVMEAPMEALGRIAAKTGYLLGFDTWSGDTLRINPALTLTWLLAMLGAVTTWRDRDQRADTTLLTCWVGAVVLPLLVIFPWGYGWRLQGPAMAPLYLLAALGLVRLWALRSLARQPTRTP